MRKIICFALFLGCWTGVKAQNAVTQTHYQSSLRAPAVPLVTVDPYFSIWSQSDCLNQSGTVHWTDRSHPIIGAVRVDGVAYRIIGQEEPFLKPVLNTAKEGRWSAQYVNVKPDGEWTAVSYDDSEWTNGEGPFGSKDRSPATLWSKGDVWVRRTIDLKEDLSAQNIVLEYSHDDVFELYINGIEVANTGNTYKDGIRITLDDKVKRTLRGGKATIAAHCHNTTGGAYVDFGLYKEMDNGAQFKNVAKQLNVNVTPTRSIYTFGCGGVEVDVVFTAPLIMSDLELMSLPVNYMSYVVRPTDGKRHNVELFVEASPLIAVNEASQKTLCTIGRSGKMDYVKCGNVDQKVLHKSGDRVAIDWGYFYMAQSTDGGGSFAIADYYDAKRAFINGREIKSLANECEVEYPERKAGMVYYKNLGQVAKSKSGYLMLAYDDVYAAEYFGENLRPYWNRKGDKTIADALAVSADNYNKVIDRCVAFDKEMMDEAVKAGGRKYAELCALAYRQAIAAHKLAADKNGELLYFSKENSSNGCMATIDITYPSAPMFMLYNPELVKAMLNPIFYYSESGKWTKPFAAHDIGTYPKGNGQTYKHDMPVEENGNVLILVNTIARCDGNAEYARKHWDVLTVWADYLVKEGLDPENQLCTDDFAGHFAHNANLSVKAIMGVACYADLAKMLDKKSIAEKYMNTAKDMAAKWRQMAADGDHYKLTFDKAGTWSQKYNLVWDKVLGLGVFDQSIAPTEIAYYLTKQNQYGLPLDSRKDYTKSDWIMWTACLTDNQEDFQRFVAPVYDYAHQTESRVPLSDWHGTKNGKMVVFKARSVIGGYYLKMLMDRLSAK